jgi:ribosomal protein S18 acetylase RimI-like enzyme
MINAKTISYRRAAPSDMEWAYQIFKRVMQCYIEKTWGWNELFQRHSFQENLPASGFTIISVDGVDIGGYCLKVKPGHLHLEMLLIDAEWQRQGYGKQVMQQLLQQARTAGLPVKLSVLKNNPAFGFYQTMGFVVENEDRFRYQLVFNH